MGAIAQDGESGMKRYDVIQGSPEWHKLRCGLFTASTFGKVLTPKTLKLSASAKMLENTIVAEQLTGDPVDEDDKDIYGEWGGTKYMQRGKALEPRAVELYELATGEKTEVVGFITNDAGTIGCSPDRLVGEHGGLQVKCLKPKNHVSLFFADEGEEVAAFEAKHIPQIQGEMWVAQRKWWDIWFYHPKMKPFCRRYERDVLYIARLEAALNQMIKNVAEKVARMKEQ